MLLFSLFTTVAEHTKFPPAALVKNTLPLRRSGRSVYGLGTAVAARGVGVSRALVASGASAVASVAGTGSILTAAPEDVASADGPDARGLPGSVDVSGLARLIRSGVQYSPAASACCCGTVEETTPASLRGAARAGPAAMQATIPTVKSVCSALDVNDFTLIASLSLPS
jgi:hypothetical protein